MRLRHRLLLLFAGFALVPLLAMGAFDHARSLRHLEAVLSVQTRIIVDRAAQELKDRLDLQASDIGLLSENAEVQRLLTLTPKVATAAERDAARRNADSYWQELWRTMRFGYEHLTLFDATGRPELSLSAGGDTESAHTGPPPSRVRDVRSVKTGAVIGRLEFTPRAEDLVRSPVFRSVFGAEGRTFVVDRSLRRILFEPSSTTIQQGGLPFDLARLDTERGTFAYRDGGPRQVASFVSFADPPWTLFVTASLDEFADPFIRLRRLDLSVLLAVVLAVSAGFFVLLRRATASLDRMTLAADRVGRGDFSPDLPPPGSDEVGRLSAAFAVMTARVREMIAQVEASRQMGVLGRFAAELSHEIRNPLTAIKINLQGLSRDARDGRIPEDSSRAVDLALREIRRLDLAVKAALRTGKPPSDPRPFHVQEVVAESVDLIRAQAAEHGVTIHHAANVSDDRRTGDPEAIRGALLNLLLNAIEAMPAGGNLWVTSTRATMEDAPAIELRIRDDGPGIPRDHRDRVFRPFFTTKGDGTGLGLSLALQAIRGHGGALSIAESPPPGTEFVITLPLSPVPVPA